MPASDSLTQGQKQLILKINSLLSLNQACKLKSACKNNRSQNNRSQNNRFLASRVRSMKHTVSEPKGKGDDSKLKALI